jgi:exonuclease SbcD
MIPAKAPGTTRIVFVGDSHFDERDRLDECAAIHGRIADFVKANGVDAVVHTGDIFERKSTLAERIAVADWLSQIDSLPVVLIRGNHDQPGELTFFTRMFKNVEAVEDTRVVHLWKNFGREHIASIACIAWPERAAIFAAVGSHDEGEASLAAALRAVFVGLETDLKNGAGFPGYPDGRVHFAAAHAMVRGATTSVGQPLMGCDMEVGTSDLATLGVPLVALGHIHKPQEWDVGGAEIVYTGSPRRTSFGENEEKGIVVADFGADGALLQRFRWSTSATPMLDIELEFKPDEVMILPLIDVAGAEVRFRYSVTPERQDQARAWAKATAAHWTEAGAIRVKIEPEVVAAVRARTPEIALATTDAQKLETYWAAKGISLGEDERADLLHKLATAKVA